MVNTIIDSMNDCFQKGDVVSIPKFGTFEVKKRLERIVVNPGTKQRMLVPPKLVLGFKPIASLKEKVKMEGRDNGKEFGTGNSRCDSRQAWFVAAGC